MTPAKYTLLTNIEFVQFSEAQIRMWCHALLIEEDGRGIMDEPINSIRGFGMEAAWPVFTYWFKPEALPFEIIAKVQDKSHVMMSGDKAVPIFQGSLLKFADGKSFFLQIDDSSMPLDRLEGITEITEIWRALETKCAQYYNAPNMPHLYWSRSQRWEAQHRSKT
jgi:hypothetical protein